MNIAEPLRKSLLQKDAAAKAAKQLLDVAVESAALALGLNPVDNLHFD